MSKFNIAIGNNESGVSGFNIAVGNNKSGVSGFNIAVGNNKPGVSGLNIVSDNNKSGVSGLNIVSDNNKSGVFGLNIVSDNNKSGVSELNIVSDNNKSGVSVLNIVSDNDTHPHPECLKTPNNAPSEAIGSHHATDKHPEDRPALPPRMSIVNIGKPVSSKLFDDRRLSAPPCTILQDVERCKMHDSARFLNDFARPLRPLSPQLCGRK